MKYWPAVVSATVALAVAIPVLHELVPDFRLFERAEAATEQPPTTGKIGSALALKAVEIDRMFLGNDAATAPAGAGRIAHLTVDPRLQRVAEKSLRTRRVPVGGAMLMNLRSGELLAYAAKHNGKRKDHPLLSAKAPAADVFKLITSTALVNLTGAGASTRMCHRDVGKKLDFEDLIEDKAADTWCPPMSEALARNLDAPFARAAYNKLNGDALTKTAAAFGFGTPIPFDFDVESSRVDIPETDLGLIETAIGADHATMSALQGLLIAATIANKGMMIQPILVRSIVGPEGKALYRGAKGPRFLRRVIGSETAIELTAMMFETIEIGNAFQAFHDNTGHPVLGTFKAAGKDGADRQKKSSAQYTWFIGFAPVGNPEVAVATIAKNRRDSNNNAKLLAVDMLKGYFDSRLAAPAHKTEQTKEAP